MRSINAGYDTNFYGGDKCATFGTAPGSPTAYALGVALDYIFSNSIVSYGNNTGPLVVNISMNQGTETGFSVNGYAMSNQPRVAGLAQPSSGYPTWLHMYPGNVVVQSAGNINQNACNNSVTVHLPNGATAIQNATYIYKPTAVSSTSDPADGILVVGALNSDGQRASPFSPAYPEVGGTPFTDPGSNYGDCIDIWAPGNFIYSTWGKANNLTTQGAFYSGRQPATCSSGLCTSPPETGWAHLSGTSMAAPHVAAAAAYYIDKYGLTTPAQVEQMLRSTATGSPGNTSLPSGLNMVQLQ